jgi:hypothetical protein
MPAAGAASRWLRSGCAGCAGRAGADHWRSGWPLDSQARDLDGNQRHGCAAEAPAAIRGCAMGVSAKRLVLLVAAMLLCAAGEASADRPGSSSRGRRPQLGRSGQRFVAARQQVRIKLEGRRGELRRSLKRTGGRLSARSRRHRGLLPRRTGIIRQVPVTARGRVTARPALAASRLAGRRAAVRHHLARHSRSVRYQQHPR